jgi:uncharacterized FAD-dependent dehydrogenase
MTYATYVGDTDDEDGAVHRPTSFMQDDIAALQYMYGANYNYRADDTTYSWNPMIGEMTVNGAAQGSPFANSGLVVSIEPSDWERAGFSGPLGGIELQRAIERAAFRAGGGELRAPAARVSDFVRGRASSSVPESSYIPGIVGADLASVLDAGGVPIADRLAQALGAFGRRMAGYVSDEAVLIGVESRTSAPVRVPRDAVSLEALGIRGLYPAGEGAGYAGGIVSAALDGVRVAQAVMRRASP